MKFGYKTEGTMLAGNIDFPRRYRETLAEIKLAEECGFDSIGVSDQHFNAPGAAIPQPDLFLSYAATNTKRVKIRTHTLTLTMRHPVMIAETMATLDVLSEGRMEFGTGRGNNLSAFKTFGIDYETSYERYKEALAVIVGAWREPGEFEFEGEFYNVPGVRVTPKPFERDAIEIWYAALSPQSHANAGELGVGLFTTTDGRPLEKVQERLDMYRKAIKDPKPVADYAINENITFLIGGHCDITNHRAREVAEPALLEWIEGATAMYQKTVNKARPDVDFSRAKSHYRYESLNENLHFISGDPDFWIEKLELLATLGVDEVDINFHGLPHKDIVRAMDLLGKYVFPHFRASKIAR